jgi:RNA polymerase sigma-B factor
VVVGRQEEKRLFLEYRRTGAERDRNALVERFLPLARSLARRYRRASEPLEDLEQVACLALVKAVEGFDSTRDTAFSSYAVPSIAGAIKRHFRDFGWSIHVPRDLQELAVRVERISEEMSGRSGRSPTAAEIAAQAGVGIEDVIEAREAYRSLRSVSLDQPRGAGAEEGDSLVDTLDAGDTELLRASDRVALDTLLATLAPRDRLILRLYYEHDLTQAEIGRRLGYSQMHVSRLMRQAIARLASAAGAEPPDVPMAPVPAEPSRLRVRAEAALPPSVNYLRTRQPAAGAL